MQDLIKYFYQMSAHQRFRIKTSLIVYKDSKSKKQNFRKLLKIKCNKET